MKKIVLPEEDVVHERVDHLIEHRFPWLLLGLFGGLVATIIVSRFEAILAADVRVAFFIPIIVYLSDAVGTQAETIYVRTLSKKEKIHLPSYLLKESMVGAGLGFISLIVIGLFGWLWLSSLRLGLTVGITMFINLTMAPILAVLIPSFLYKHHADPALGSGPVATIIQDLLSLFVYFIVASVILFI